MEEKVTECLEKISEAKTGKNRYGETTHYSVYRLAEGDANE